MQIEAAKRISVTLKAAEDSCPVSKIIHSSIISSNKVSVAVVVVVVVD